MDETIGIQLAKRVKYECRSCGTLQAVPTLPFEATARCSCCYHVLRRTRRDPLVRPLASALAGIALYTVVLLLPFMQIRLWDWAHATTLLAFPAQLQTNGFWELAVAKRRGVNPDPMSNISYTEGNQHDKTS